MKKIVILGLITGVFNLNAQDNKIESTGNVGIGTVNPNFGLTINSVEDQTSLGANKKSVIRLMNGYASAFGRKSELQFSISQSSSELLAVIAAEYTSWSNNIGGDLIFGTSPTTSTNVIERLRINKDGNIGIGTNNPSERLTVNGNIKMLGSNKNMEWSTSNWGEGFGHKIYSKDPGGKTLLNIAARHNTKSWTDLMTFTSDGKIGIGTTNPDMKLTVKGNIHAEEVKIDLNVPVPDYVFKSDYNLRSIEEVESFIKEHSHLPEIPSAREFSENGVMLAEMNMNLLKKIEELTLYTIQQHREIEELKLQNKKLLELQSRLEKLESER